MTLEQARAEALRWVNSWRMHQHRDPLDALPKGERGNGCRCPLAKATGLFIDGDHAYPWGMAAGPDETLPDAVRFFALAFDQGRYPDLQEMG